MRKDERLFGDAALSTVQPQLSLSIAHFSHCPYFPFQDVLYLHTVFLPPFTVNACSFTFSVPPPPIQYLPSQGVQGTLTLSYNFLHSREWSTPRVPTGTYSYCWGRNLTVPWSPSTDSGSLTTTWGRTRREVCRFHCIVTPVIHCRLLSIT